MVDMRRQEDKELVKEALKEWLDEKFALFGKYTVKGIASAVLGYTLVYLINHGFNIFKG